ncbi:hypothetical protein HMPREF9445_02380 [Bacteroides clarus YIT 12056]|uniref:Uncharacterized protein n=1 Tax=Bacteroides clarus YIT 12056 TaxID=762984 RepID=A0ABP2KRL0_9BACE|nr:hypothetical protein HMPREF9445_02380 [Bacteroides clarus YIT 12056]
MALIETLFYLGVSLQVITNNVYLIYYCLWLLLFVVGLAD